MGQRQRGESEAPAKERAEEPLRKPEMYQESQVITNFSFEPEEWVKF